MNSRKARYTEDDFFYGKLAIQTQSIKNTHLLLLFVPVCYALEKQSSSLGWVTLIQLDTPLTVVKPSKSSKTLSNLPSTQKRRKERDKKMVTQQILSDRQESSCVQPHRATNWHMKTLYVEKCNRKALFHNKKAQVFDDTWYVH